MGRRIYTLNWLAAIAPEVALIPGADIFERTQQAISLTAISPEQPGLLFTMPDTFIEHVLCASKPSATTQQQHEHALLHA